MNSPTRYIHRFVAPLLLIAACMSVIHPLPATPVATNAPTASGTNGPAGTNSLRLSMFDTDSPSGKDPFFPRSTRRALEFSATASSTLADTSALTLQGVSGSGARAFATINNRTFQVGEEGEVLTPSGRFRIRCVEVKTHSVVVSLGASSRLELRLPQR